MLHRALRAGLVDTPPSRVVATWNKGDTNPLIRPFARIATCAYRDGTSPA